MIDIIKRYLGGNKRSATVKLNILVALIVKGMSILISLALVPLTLGYVNKEMYGIWLTISSIVVWLGFFDIGFNLGLKNKLAEAIANNDWQRGRILVSTTYAMMFIIFIPLCIILELCIPLIDWASVLNVSSAYNEELRIVLRVLAALICLQMIVFVINAVNDAFQRVALTSTLLMIGNLIALVAIIILRLCCTGRLLYLALSLTFIPILVVLIASIILYYTKYKNVAPSLHAVDMSYVRSLFNLGLKFFIIQIQGLVMFQTTNILIARLSGPTDVTAYNIAYRYVGVATMIFNIILAPLWPAFTDAYTRNDRAWMRNAYSKMTKVFIVSVFCMLFMVIASPNIYDLWIGDRSVVPFAMTAVVSIYTIIHAWDLMQVMMINGIGAVKLQSFVTLIGLIFHIPLSFLLGRYVGGYGVVLSMIIIITIYSIFFTVQIRKILAGTARGLWIS